MSFLETNMFARMVERSPFSYTDLAILILTAPKRYKEHHIKKRSGGLRLIAQPTKELKFVQRLLISNELSHLKVSEAAAAYVKERSIKEHAEKHAGNRYLLKLDFKDFFPSITKDAINRLLIQQTDLSADERYIACQLLLRSPKKEETLRLSIGAPSSPFISNCVMYEFDEKLLGYCQANGITYSRYADDIALSTQNPRTLDPAKAFVEGLLSQLDYLKLSLNPAKTVNVSTKNRRTLTGLVLSNEGTASIGRDKKRLIRAQVHSMIKGQLSTEEAVSLKGHLSFLYSVDKSFVVNLARRYGLDAKSLMTYRTSSTDSLPPQPDKSS
ncbi:MAG: RNA-directed DNA polymerase [Burkholderiales bacterium]|nr:RNA-directed DNA polymerase [Burkholderiales bacterium]